MNQSQIPDTVPNNDGYFGWCPDCFNVGIHRVNEGMVLTTAEGDHWMTCPIHKVKWFLGNNLFSAWRDANPGELRENENDLSYCKEVDSIER